MASTLKANETAQSVVVNPETIAAQVKGVERGNFHDYRTTGKKEVSLVETHIKSTESPGEFGEAPGAYVTPAIVNAIFDVTASASATCRSIPASSNPE
jgi:CO/xanthine dehydrogenase Mo-binding subunit